MTAGEAEERRPREGDVLAGKYRVLRMIGTGGMGYVVAARHIALEEDVAVKLVRSELAGDATQRARFLREARTAAKIKNEHVARVIDVDNLEDGRPFLVMELLSGGDLSRFVHGKLLPISTVVEYLLQACEGLAEAHALGVVHRDLKPHNLFLARRADGSEIIKVLDFGISKISSASESRITKTRESMGTPAYMSPEQLRSAKDVDARADIWSLGVVLFELVAGALPFDAESIGELCTKILMDPPAALPASLPAGLEAVIRRCLEKQASRRYATVAELARALRPFAGGDSTARVQRIERLSRRQEQDSTPSVLVDEDDRLAHAATQRAGELDATVLARGRRVGQRSAHLVIIGIAGVMAAALLGTAAYLYPSRAPMTPSAVTALAATPLPPPDVTPTPPAPPEPLATAPPAPPSSEVSAVPRTRPAPNRRRPATTTVTASAPAASPPPAPPPPPPAPTGFDPTSRH